MNLFALIAAILLFLMPPEQYSPGDDDTESAVKYLTAVVTSQPADAVGVIGGQVQFTFNYSAVIASPFVLLWQIQTDGSTWSDLVETAGYYEGVATTTLTVKAIDNYLALRTSLNFRCKLVFAGAVVTFTGTAALSIPIHTNWRGYYGAAASAVTGAACALQINPPVPTVTGFAGPYTYSWTRVGGSATFTCTTPTLPNASFAIAATAAGLQYSIWTCTITSGLNSVTTDPLYLFAFGLTAPALTANQNTVPDVSQVGGQLTAFGTFVAPWAVALQVNGRQIGTPAISITTPNASSTTFTRNAAQPGGTYILAFPYCAVTQTLDNAVSLGNTVWEQ